jgi:steroid delta-isomerase-like uncharacterized protein
LSAEENKAVVRRQFEEIFNERNLAIIEEITAEDYQEHGAAPLRSVGSATRSGKAYGPQQVRAAVGLVLKAFPDIPFTIEDMVAERDKVAAFVTMSGTHEGKFGGVPPTGRRVSVQQVHWFRIADGKVAEHWAIRDDLSTMRQLGVVSAPD